MYTYLKGKRFIGLIAAIIILSIVVPYILDAFKPTDKWSISEDGVLSYPENRGAVEYTKMALNDTLEFTLSKIVYESKGEKIYALLRVQKTKTGKMPAIILLPGATVTKEAMQDRAEKFAEWGYITLTIDEWGNRGETGGGIMSMDDEYAAFVRNKEPVQHKMVFDVLRAYDFLREQDYVDSKNIAVFGESMGARFAIIAGAIEPRIKGVIAVSTSGYGSLAGQFPNADVARFFRSIDPDFYIWRIAPRNILMVHSANDTVIPISAAEETFGYAKEPKRFVLVGCRTHGWCDEMEPAVKKELEKIFLR